MTKRSRKPHLTETQIKKIQWLDVPRKKDAIMIGRFEEFWILSKNEPDSLILVYDQAEWACFVAGVKDNVFDDLAK